MDIRKDRKKVDPVHRARVRSTVWNIFHVGGTLLSRQKTISFNPTFDYSQHLLRSQPLDVTLVFDIRNVTDQTRASELYNKVLATNPNIKEFLFVTVKDFITPSVKNTTSFRNIVDHSAGALGVTEFGFMCSNTDLVFFCDLDLYTSDTNYFTPDRLADTLLDVTSRESSIVVSMPKITSDFRIIDSKINVVAFRKSQLVNFLNVRDDIESLGAKQIGAFVSWAIMQCQPLTKIQTDSKVSTLKVTPRSNDYPVLTGYSKWLVKKTLRSLHLSRLVSKLFKVLRQPTKNGLDDSVNEVPVLRSAPMPAVSKKDIKNVPIFINTRDRVEPLQLLVGWLESCGYKNIVFIDNDSTYEPLLDYFDQIPYQVVKLGRNGMHKAPWESFAVRFIAQDKPYIVTDPDIIPSDTTPNSTIEKLFNVLSRFPGYDKAGVALKIDDLPDHYSLRQSVIDWESRFWDDKLAIGENIYAADVDTTLALYKPRTWWFLSPSIRVGGKYAMKHEPWYQNLDNPSEDMLYYRVRASNEVSTWTKGKLPKHHLRALKKEGLL